MKSFGLHFSRLLFILLLIFGTAFKQDKKIKWVAIGDSITYLNDHPDETKNRSGEGYLTQVVKELKYLEYVNQGHNGWKSVDIARRIDSINLVPADVYTIFLGTNDWWHGVAAGSLADYVNDAGATTVSGAYRKIVNKIRALNKDAKIIAITPLQRNDFVYINNFKNNAYGSYKKKNDQSLEQVANAISAIAAYEKFPVVDLYHDKDLRMERLVKFKRLKDPASGQYRDYKYPASTNIPFNPETDEYPYPAEASDMTYDGLHPSGAGNAVIAKRLRMQFETLYGR